MKNWADCKNILCIRPDNMGDLIMTGPALRALKESFGCRITMLTSSMAAGISPLMPEVDEVMVFDVPWVKNNNSSYQDSFNETVSTIKSRQFDAAIIFTVYSQNPLPTVMLAYLAGIPLRLAYCRENPYQLLTDWVPDQEPYNLIKHQVRRDLDLVATIGATTLNQQLILKTDSTLQKQLLQKLAEIGIDTNKPWLIFHPGVSEAKREYPLDKWIEAGLAVKANGYQILLTGAKGECTLCSTIQQAIGTACVNAAGLHKLDAFVNLISLAPVVVSVNTGTVHIAAAVGTPVVVLYALTNPQHTPWYVPNQVLPFPVPVNAQSKNEVVRYVNHFLAGNTTKMPNAADIVYAIDALLNADINTNAEPATIGLPAIVPVQNPVL